MFSPEEKEKMGETPVVGIDEDDYAMGRDFELPPELWDGIRQIDDDYDREKTIELADLVVSDGEEAAEDEGEETNCPGKKYPREKARLVDDIWLRHNSKRVAEYQRQCEEIAASGEGDATYPSFPLRVFTEVTGLCVLGDNCHHREFRTHDTSTTRSTLGYREPREMIQIFSLRLSSSGSYPVSVYGIVAVRDRLEPLRNLLFNRPHRDDAVPVDRDSLILPLCSPCRGMYLRGRALLEVDLWAKTEGDGSSEKQLLSVYSELEMMYEFDEILEGELTSDLCSMVVNYLVLRESVEAVIQVFAKVDRPRRVRFDAFTSGFDQEIVMFDEELSWDKKMLQHIVVVKADGKLDIRLKLEESVFWWTFQKGVVGAVRAPDYSLLKYGQFEVRVFFAPKTFADVG